MPRAIDLHHELGPKGLVVILSEVQGTPRERVPGFLWSHWQECGIRSASGLRLPVDTGRGIPACAVIGVDGTLLAAGATGRLGSKVDELIAEELGKRSKGWGATPAIRKARVAIHARQRFAEAKELIHAGLEEEANEHGDEWRAVEQELATAWAWRVRAVGFLQDEGRFVEAQALAEELQRGAAGIDEWEATAQELVAAFATEAGQRELALEKKLARLTQMFQRKLLEGQEERQLERALRGAEAESRVAARVRRLIAVIHDGDQPKK